jgi:hypothetical protein
VSEVTDSSRDSKSLYPGFWLCWLALAATFVLFAAASFLPDKRLWGINHLAFYTQPVRLAVLLVTGLFLIPPLASAAWGATLWLVRPYFRGLNDGANAIALTGVASFVVFAAFRSSTRLLGDGYFIVNNFIEAAEGGMGISDYFDLVTIKERVYPATELLNYAASWTAARFGASPSGGVWIVNCVIGAAVVVGLLAAVRRTGWPDGAKLAVTALALFTGAIELFFGYVEHYTPAVALGALYVLTALRVVAGKSPLYRPGAVLAVGTLFHVQSLLLAPSYVWLVLWTVGFKRSPSRGGLVAAVVGAVTVIAAVAAGFVPALSRFFLRPAGDGGYGVFSVAHLCDVANEVLLLCPVWLLYAALVVPRWFARHRDPDPEHRGGGAFAWTLTVPAVLFLLLFKPELGMARDWDLYCFTLFGLAAPGLIALARYIAQPRQPNGTVPIAAPAVALSVALVVSWVGVNADPERSVARYRAVLEHDRTNVSYAYETLARHYEDNFQYTRQIEALGMAYDTSRNPRFLLKLGLVYNENDDPANAVKSLETYLIARPKDDAVRKLLLGVLVGQNAVDEMIRVSLAGIRQSPRIPDYHFFLGNAYLAKGMTKEGFKAFETCSKLNPPPVMVREMLRLMEQAGKAPSDSR